MKTFKEFLRLKEVQDMNNPDPTNAQPKPPTPQEQQSQRKVKVALAATVAKTGKPPGMMSPTKVLQNADPNLNPEELARLGKIAATGG